MTRKQFFAFFVGAGIALAQLPVVYASKEEGQFVTAFNLWATLGNKNGAIVDVKEIRAWHDTKSAWNKLKHIVDQSYK